MNIQFLVFFKHALEQPNCLIWKKIRAVMNITLTKEVNVKKAHPVHLTQSDPPLVSKSSLVSTEPYLTF